MGALDLSLPLFEHAGPSRLAVEAHHTLAHTMWITLRHEPTRGMHNFSLQLLHQLHALVQQLQAMQSHRQIQDGSCSLNPFPSAAGMGAACSHAVCRLVPTAPLHYAVMRSDHADYFNAGGDLKYFRQCIAEQNRQGLYQYSMLCLDVLLGWAACSQGQTSTIALVQGRALGGGFEAALAADYLIAEEHSTFGFPEIMFGLFPCTGAMHLLSRRVGAGLAERMMTNGKIYSARELHEMGIVDAVCARGQGEAEVERFIGQHARRRAARQSVERSRKRLAPLEYRELAIIVDDWVEVAMSLEQDALRVMDMLILMQEAVAPESGPGSAATATCH